VKRLRKPEWLKERDVKKGIRRFEKFKRTGLAIPGDEVKALD
jgi:hypothetical protein